MGGGVISIFSLKASINEFKPEYGEFCKKKACDGAEATSVNEDRIFRLLKQGGDKDGCNAKIFLAGSDIREEHIEELEDIELQIAYFLRSDIRKLSKLHRLGEFFLRYSTAIERFVEFNDLKVGVYELADILINLNENTNDETLDKMLFYVFNIKEDLASWRSRVFVFKDAQNIHYLDSSLLSCVAAVKSEVDQNSKNIIQNSELELF